MHSYASNPITAIAPPQLSNGSGLVMRCDPIGDDYAASLGDETIAYVLEAQKVFRKLRQAISQIAGALVLNAAAASSSSIAVEGYRLARASMAEVAEMYGALRSTKRSVHHHHHLKLAIGLVSEALVAQQNLPSAVHGSAPDRDILPNLKRAWQELAHAGNSRPGFEVVDFGQACCAFHQKSTG